MPRTKEQREIVVSLEFTRTGAMKEGWSGGRCSHKKPVARMGH
jgi:hypothetical protein